MPKLWAALCLMCSMISVTSAQAQPTILSYQANTTTIDRIQGVRLSWQTSGAARVDIRDGFRNVIIPNLGERNYIEVWPERTATYTLLAYGADGSLAEQSITINFAAASIVSFVASTNEVRSVQAVRLSWQVSGALRVAIVDSNTNQTYDHLPLTGSIDVWPERSSTYTLQVFTHAGLAVTRDLRITANLPPLVDELYASPMSVREGQTVELSWRTRYAARVELSDDRGSVRQGNLPFNGTFLVTPTANTIYTVTAYNDLGVTAMRQVTVKVEYSEPVVHYFRSLSNNLPAGTPVTLEWSTDFAEYINIEGPGLGHGGLRYLPRAGTVEVRPFRSGTYILYAVSANGRFARAYTEVYVAP